MTYDPADPACGQRIAAATIESLRTMFPLYDYTACEVTDVMAYECGEQRGNGRVMAVLRDFDIVVFGVEK